MSDWLPEHDFFTPHTFFKGLLIIYFTLCNMIACSEQNKNIIIFKSHILGD